MASQQTSARGSKFVASLGLVLVLITGVLAACGERARAPSSAAQPASNGQTVGENASGLAAPDEYAPGSPRYPGRIAYRLSHAPACASATTIPGVYDRLTLADLDHDNTRLPGQVRQRLIAERLHPAPAC